VENLINAALDILRDLGPAKWLVYVVLVGLVIRGLAGVVRDVEYMSRIIGRLWTRLTRRQLSDSRLRKELEDVARTLVEYLGERERANPTRTNWPPPHYETETERHEAWVKETRRITEYYQQTMARYFTDFAPRVARVRDELLRRGLWPQGLDSLYKHPTNPLGLQELSLRLMEQRESVGRDLGQ
jgi:hypothetical protein